jgi:predicted nuclease of predicted toxin-antitoxin system
MPKFKLDENLPKEAADLLQDAGYDAATIWDQQMVGAPDSKVASVCKDEDRVLVTLDLDFADIRLYRPADHAGIIVLRVPQQDKQNVLEIIDRLIPVLAQESAAGLLWVVDNKRIRIHA